MKRQVADRLFMSVLCMTTVGTSMFEDSSTSFVMVTSGGLPAEICMMVLLGLSVLTLLDTIVNDLLPAPYTFKIGWRFRQMLWMMIAITFVGLGFVAVRFGISLWLAVTMTAYGARCAAVSFLDLFYEHRDVIQGRRSTDFGAL